MIGLDKKQALVERICKSKTFSNAPTSIALLQYLAKATFNEVDLKESIIELEFFGAKETTNKSNPKVRVNVYNLRKKLNQYYEEEGKDDAYQLIIDKGQYLIRFEKVSNPGMVDRYIKTPAAIPYFVAAFILVIMILSHIPASKPHIWKPFLKDKSSTLYIGDVFGMIGKTTTGNFGWTRDYSINNTNDYYRLIEEQPHLKKKLLPPPYTYTTQMGVFAAKNLQAFFSKYESNFGVRFTSKTSIDEIKSGNAIYVGPIKNDNPFIRFFNEGNEYFHLQDSILHLSNHPTVKDTSFLFPFRVSNEELAIVSGISGPNNTRQLLFFSNHDIGVSSTFQFFTNMDSAKAFTKKHLNGYDNFTAIFKAKGLNRTDTDMEIIEVIPF